MSKILAQGMITLTQLYEGAQVILTPAAVLIPCDSNETPKPNAYINAFTNVKVFLGTMDITSKITLGALEYSDSTVRASKTGTKVSITTITTRTGYVDIPVSVTIDGETIDLGKHRFSFVKQIDGQTGQPGIQGDPGFSYTLNIKGGTRGIAYAANGTNPEPKTSSQFSVELLKNGVKVANPASISWTCGGNLSGSSSAATFTPTIKSTYNSESSYVKVSVKEFAASLAVEETIPIICTKHADGLDWINEWNNKYVQVGTEKIITPKIFAGTKSSANELTGVAIGRDVLGGNANKVIGIVGYKKNTPVFSLDQDANFFISSSGNAGDIKNGTNNAKGIYFDGNNLYVSGKVKISGGSTIGESNTSVEEVINNSNLGAQANNKIDNLSIGGRNIATHTNQGTTGWGWGLQTGGKTISEVTENGIKCCKMVRDNTAQSGWSFISYSKIGREKYLPSKQYTISFEVKSSVATNFTCSLMKGDATDGLTTNAATAQVPKVNTWTKLSFTLTTKDTLPTSTTQCVYLNGMSSDPGVTYIFRNLMIEEGTKASSWTPAPEDIDNNITDVKNSLNSFQNTVNTSFKDGIIEQAEAKAIAQHLKTLDAEKADIDKEYSTIYGNSLLGGAAKTNLANAKTSFDSAHSSLKSTINTAISDGKITSTEKANVDSAFTTYNGVLGTYKQRVQEALDAIGSAKVNNIKIGGTNLAANTSIPYTSPAITGNGSNTWENNGIVSYYRHGIEWIAGEPLTISFDYVIDWSNVNGITEEIKNGAGCGIGASKNAGSTYAEDFNIIASFKTYGGNNTQGHFVYTITRNTISSNKYFAFRPFRCDTENTCNGAVITISNFKVERGNKATDWSPAPEDIDNNITDVKNSLSGFQNTVNTTFKDGIIEQAEAKAIARHIQILDTEKADVDKEYSTIYNNSALSGTAKTNLASAKTEFDNAHTSLKSTINTAIADGKVSSSEKTSVDRTFSTYNSILGTYKQRVQEALDAISSAKVDNIQVGGRNLAKNSIVVVYAGSLDKSNYTSSGTLITGINGTHQGFRFDSQSIYEANQQYVLSFYIQKRSGTINQLGMIHNGKGHKNVKVVCDGISKGDFAQANTSVGAIMDDGNIHKIEVYFTTSSNIPADSGVAYTYIQLNKETGTPCSAKITKFKLEKGSMPTDWTPAPEDIQADVDKKANSSDVYKKTETYTKTETDSAIQVSKDAIELGVKNTYETKTNVESKISTANTNTLNSAKSYADTKKTEAINSAASDAANKVNSAKNELNTKIDGIQIGGRNLFLNSGFTKGLKYWYTYNCSGQQVVADSSALSGYAVKFTSAGGGIYQRKGGASNNPTNYPNGSVMTVSGYVKSSVANKVLRPSFESAGGNNSKNITCANANTWYYFTHTHKIATNNFHTVTFYGDSGADYYLKDLMLEYGNKASTWTLAPEDVAANIDAAKSEAINSANNTLTTTIANYYTKEETNSQINIAKEAINLEVSNTYETKSNVETKVNNAVAGLKVGGNNLLRNGNFVYDMANWLTHDMSSGGTAKSIAIGTNGDWVPAGKKALVIRGTNTTDRYGVRSSTMKLTPKTKYTISGYCAGHRVNKIQVNVRDVQNADANIHTINIDPVQGGNTLDKWHRFETTFTTTANTDFALNLYSVNFANNGLVWFTDVQVQEGTKATAWTPCLEDINSSINSKANSSDVYTKSEVFTKEETNSQINIAKEAINLGVSNTYETKSNVETKISSIQVGGTNLVENSAFLQGNRKWSGNILVDINKKLGSHPSAKISKTGATSNTWYGTTQTLTNRTFFNGETYTVSCWYYCEDINTFDGNFGLELKGNKEGTTSDAGLVGIGIPKTDLVQGKWTRVVLTKTLNANWNNVYAYCWVQKNGTIWVTDIQVEKGNKATDWSPAPEDSDYSISQAEQNAIDSASTDATNKVNSAKSELNTAINNIKVGGRNLLIHKDEIKNTCLNPSGEIISNNTTNTMKDFIAVKPKEIITFQKETSNEYFRWNWYDSDKVYMSRKPDNSNLFQWTVPEGAYYIRVSYPNTGNVKVERGNKATDWTPAPEDVDSAINKKANSADVYAKTEVYTKEETNSQINIAKDQINLGVSNTYETKANVENKISTAVNNVQIGGRNLAYKETIKPFSSSTLDLTEYVKKGKLIVTRPTGTGDGGFYFDKLIKYKKNTKYIVHFYMTCTKYTIKNIHFHNGQKLVSTKIYIDDVYVGTIGTIIDTSVFDDGLSHKVRMEYTTPSTLVDSSAGVNQTYFQPNKTLPNNTYTVIIEEFMVEEGTKAGSWTPAPEDIDSAIGTKANASNVYNKTEVYTKTETNSQINIAKEEINLGVSNTYETKTNVENKINAAVDNVQVGGRNLALGTGKAIGDVSHGSGSSSPYSATDLFNGITAIKTNTEWTGRYFNLKAIAQRGGFKAGDNLVLSVYIKADQNVTLNITSHRTKGTGNTLGSDKVYHNFTVTPKWQQVWFPFVADEGSLDSEYARIEVNIATGNNYIHWAGWKLEKGTKPSDWTPAPEDVDSAIGTKANSADVYTKSEVYTKTETNSQITATTDAITSRVSSLESKEVANREVTAFRYVRDWLRGSTANPGNHWVELQVWANGSNIAQGKTVTTNGTVNSNHPINRFTDGNTSTSQFAEVQNDGSWRYLQVDLGEIHYNIDYLRVWHYYNDLRRYNHKLEVSVDGSTWYTIYNSDISGAYTETADGRVHIINETSTEKRLKTAESKITDSAIINTVSSTIQNAKNEAINSANSSTDNKLQSYATNSSLTQTANDITAKFTSTGGYNLLKNSDAKNGTSFWVDNGGGLSVSTGGAAPFIGEKEFKTSFPSGMRYYEAIKLKPSTEYVYEAWVYCQNTFPGSSAMPLHFWCNTTANTAGAGQCTILDYRQSLTAGAYKKVYVHFKTKTGDVYFTPFIYYGGQTGSVAVKQISLTENKVESAWTPHPSEIYEGSTIIDATGITVNNGALKIKNKAGDIVLNGDSNGNLVLSGHIISNANIEGGIISGGSVYGGGKTLQDSLTIIDSNGLTVNHGRIRIKNKAGNTVLSGDSNGNLTLAGNITSGATISGGTIKGGIIQNNSTVIDNTGLTVTNGALRVKDGSGNLMLEGDASGTLYLRKQLKVGTVGTFSPSGINISGGSFTVSGGTPYKESSTGYIEGSTTSQSLYDNGLRGSSSMTTGSQLHRAESFYGVNGWSIYEDNSGNAMQQSFKCYSRGSGIYIQATETDKGSANVGQIVEKTRLNHEGLRTTGNVDANTLISKTLKSPTHGNNRIDLQSHNNDMWFRSISEYFTFQCGYDGDNWTKSFGIRGVNNPAEGQNTNWIDFGQMKSNATNGSYRGVSIRKYVNGGATAGDLVAGRYYMTGSENAYLTNYSNTAVKIQSPHGYCAIGPQNNGYCHYVTDRPTHWFDRNVAVQGEIRCGSGYNQLVPYGSMANGYDNGTSEVCEGRIHIGGNKYIYYGWCSISCNAGASAERTYTVPNLSRIRGITIQCYTRGGTSNFGELALKQTYSNGFTFRLYNSSNGGTHYITYMIIGE